jgi:hypothetical protein
VRQGFQPDAIKAWAEAPQGLWERMRQRQDGRRP